MVAFLLNDCKYSQRVFFRCLRDLADAGAVRFWTDPSGAVTVRAAGPASSLALRDYERVALRRVLELAGPGTGVPVSALVSDDGASFDWFLLAARPQACGTGCRGRPAAALRGRRPARLRSCGGDEAVAEA